MISFINMMFTIINHLTQDGNLYFEAFPYPLLVKC